MAEVIIEHADGRQYAIQSANFRRGKHYRDPASGQASTFEEAGFRIVSNADGSPYEAPAPRGSKASAEDKDKDED